MSEPAQNGGGVLEVGDLTKQLGVSRSTLMRYVGEGLLPAPTRTSNRLHWPDSALMSALGELNDDLAILARMTPLAAYELEAHHTFTVPASSAMTPSWARAGHLALMDSSFTVIYPVLDVEVVRAISSKTLSRRSTTGVAGDDSSSVARRTAMLWDLTRQNSRSRSTDQELTIHHVKVDDGERFHGVAGRNRAPQYLRLDAVRAAAQRADAERRSELERARAARERRRAQVEEQRARV